MNPLESVESVESVVYMREGEREAGWEPMNFFAQNTCCNEFTKGDYKSNLGLSLFDFHYKGKNMTSYLTVFMKLKEINYPRASQLLF